MQGFVAQIAYCSGGCSPGVYLGTSIEEYFDDVDITPRGS